MENEIDKNNNDNIDIDTDSTISDTNNITINQFLRKIPGVRSGIVIAAKNFVKRNGFLFDTVPIDNNGEVLGNLLLYAAAHEAGYVFQPEDFRKINLGGSQLKEYELLSVFLKEHFDITRLSLFAAEYYPELILINNEIRLKSKRIGKNTRKEISMITGISEGSLGEALYLYRNHRDVFNFLKITKYTFRDKNDILAVKYNDPVRFEKLLNHEITLQQAVFRLSKKVKKELKEVKDNPPQQNKLEGFIDDLMLEEEVLRKESSDNNIQNDTNIQLASDNRDTFITTITPDPVSSEVITKTRFKNLTTPKSNKSNDIDMDEIVVLESGLFENILDYNIKKNLSTVDKMYNDDPYNEEYYNRINSVSQADHQEEEISNDDEPTDKNKLDFLFGKKTDYDELFNSDNLTDEINFSDSLRKNNVDIDDETLNLQDKNLNYLIEEGKVHQHKKYKRNIGNIVFNFKNQEPIVLKDKKQRKLLERSVRLYQATFELIQSLALKCDDLTESEKKKLAMLQFFIEEFETDMQDYVFYE